MKKYIIIAGIPRSGKSTVSQMIAKKFGYQHVSMDSIIAGIEDVFPETKINTGSEDPFDVNLSFISSKMAPFIKAMMRSGEYDECDYGVVIDIYQLLPADFVKYIDREICDIYYFVTSDVTPDERFDILKTYDTPDDYTYHKSDEDLKEACIEYVKASKLVVEECLKYDLHYLETSRNREYIVNRFIESLS